MKSIFTIFSCVLFFVIGYIAGDKTDFDLENTSKYFDIISSLASLAAAYAAFYALFTWKSQIHHQEKISKTVGLKDAYKKLLLSFYHYRYKCMSLARERVPPEKWHTEDEFKVYTSCLADYRDLWITVRLVLGELPNDMQMYSPDRMQNKVLGFLTPLHSIETGDYKVENDSFESEIHSLLEQGNEAFIKYLGTS